MSLLIPSDTSCIVLVCGIFCAPQLSCAHPFCLLRSLHRKDLINFGESNGQSPQQSGTASGSQPASHASADQFSITEDDDDALSSGANTPLKEKVGIPHLVLEKMCMLHFSQN